MQPVNILDWKRTELNKKNPIAFLIVLSLGQWFYKSEKTKQRVVDEVLNLESYQQRQLLSTSTGSSEMALRSSPMQLQPNSKSSSSYTNDDSTGSSTFHSAINNTNYQTTNSSTSSSLAKIIDITSNRHQRWPLVSAKEQQPQVATTSYVAADQQQCNSR